MGRGGSAVVHERRIHAEPRRGVRKTARQSRSQSRLAPRTNSGSRPARSRMARRRDAPQCGRLRPGKSLRLLRLRLHTRRQAIFDENLARGRATAWRSIRRRDARPASSNRGRFCNRRRSAFEKGPQRARSLQSCHQRLRLHPVSNVCGVFEEEIRPWEGTMQSIYSDEHRFLTENYGVKYETTALQPVIGVAVFPWRDPTQYRSLLAKLSHISAIGVLLRDRDGGRVTIDAEGHPVSHYSLSNFDRAHLRSGFIGATRILEAAGARQIFSPHAKWCGYEPGRIGSLDTFTQAMDSAGWD